MYMVILEKESASRLSGQKESQSSIVHPQSKYSTNLLVSDTFVLTRTSNDSFCCPTCGLQFDSFLAATQLHPTCISWSCRYLHDDLSTTKDSTIEEIAKCRLCGYLTSKAEQFDETPISGAPEHIDYHRLRGCAQTIYTTPKDFAAHLVSEHRAESVLQSNMDPWARLQFLETINGQGIIRTTRLPTGRECCPSVEADYAFSFVNL
jgi:rubredoxin